MENTAVFHIQCFYSVPQKARFHNNQKTNNQCCTFQYGTLQCSKFSLSKNKTKNNQKYRTVLYVNTEKHGNCAWVGLWILALCAESIHGLTLPQCLRRPVPLPAEEACGHVVGGHIHYILKPKKNLL
jgi:hypothetical protein